MILQRNQQNDIGVAILVIPLPRVGDNGMIRPMQPLRAADNGMIRPMHPLRAAGNGMTPRREKNLVLIPLRRFRVGSEAAVWWLGAWAAIWRMALLPGWLRAVSMPCKLVQSAGF